jgi:hypothetical protein
MPMRMSVVGVRRRPSCVGGATVADSRSLGPPDLSWRRKDSNQMKKLTALFVAFLTACASHSGAWEPDGAVGALDMDRAKCVAQAKMVPATGNEAVDDDSRNDFFHGCMHRMGWKEKP